MLDAVSQKLFVSKMSARVLSLSSPFLSEDANRSRTFRASDDEHSVPNMSPIYVNNNHTLQPEFLKDKRRIRH
jgi:hypothetical protein